MPQVCVLVLDVEPSRADPAIEELSDGDAAAMRAVIDRNVAVLRKLGYDADFCGTDEGRTAPDLLLKTMRAKRYNCLVVCARLRLLVQRSRLLERLVNLAQVTKPDTVILFDTGPADTIATVRRWFPRGDDD